MNLEFISGLALVTVTLAVVVYVLKELIGDRVGRLGKANRNLAKSLRKSGSREGAPINAHLIGSIGNVIAHSDDSTRPMRVRLGLESWPARMNGKANSPFAVGTSVKVTEVDGPLLVVEASDDVAEPPVVDQDSR